MERLKNVDDSSVSYGVYAKYIKRILDFTISLFSLILLSPVFLVIMLLVRIKLGSPVFFTQERAGKDEISFKMIKFRTMKDTRDENGELLPDTERFTKFGDTLRKLSLDELPELINVLKGDMSLVGPRPLYTYYIPYYTKEESIRHAVRGGITGLAQINGRALCRWNDRFKYDIQYVNSISFHNDLKILFLTVYNVLKKSDIGVPSVTDEGGLHIIRELQRKDKVKEIGSSFSLNSDEISESDAFPELEKKFGYKYSRYYSTCRSCIKEIIRLINNDVTSKVVIAPSYTCESVIAGFIEDGYSIVPYNIEKDYSVDEEELLNKIRIFHPSVVIYHDYFGFCTTNNFTSMVKSCNREIIVINDRTQSMFSAIEDSTADFCVGSIRKWLPVPDGAFLMSNRRLPKQLSNEDEKLVTLECEAMTLKAKYLQDRKQDKTAFLEKFSVCRKYIDQQQEAFSMSSVSKGIFNNCSEKDINESRRKNYNYLYAGLKEISQIEIPLCQADSFTVPFLFPVDTKGAQKEMQSFLARNNVYATVIWACPEEISSDISQTVRYIYQNYLYIPCDQRYNEDDMQYIIDTVNKYFLFKEKQ